MQLAEQYRPRDWSAVVGQDKAIGQINTIRKVCGTLGGKAYFLSGKSGTGKTTIARLIAAEVAEEWATEEFDASALNTATIDRIEREMQSRSIGVKSGRAWIINEVHGLSDTQVRKVLSLIEPSPALPQFVVFCFTTTVEGQKSLFADCADASPFLSRCSPISLAQTDLAKPFAERLLAGARAEGLDGQPIEKYVRLVRDNGLNMRACWQEIESGAMLAG